MIRLLFFIACLAAGGLASGASIDDSTASQLLSSCQLHDYGELEMPAEHHESLTAWAKERGVAGFNALADQASVRTKALALFDITASDADFFKISLSALERYGRENIPESYLRSVLMPTERKRGLLAINYRDNRLQAALESCQKKLDPGSPLASLIRQILSGEQAKGVVKHAGDGGYPERYGPLAKQALDGKIPSSSPASDAQHEKGIQGRPTVERTASSKQLPATIAQPTSTTVWSIIFVLIVAATGLLWLVLKRRS